MKRESNEIKKENDCAASFGRFCEVVRHLRAEDGCPWDRAQTHTSLKPYCIEEAAEVIGGINIWEATGDAENLKEELGCRFFFTRRSRRKKDCLRYGRSWMAPAKR